MLVSDLFREALSENVHAWRGKVGSAAMASSRSEVARFDPAQEQYQP